MTGTKNKMILRHLGLKSSTLLEEDYDKSPDDANSVVKPIIAQNFREKMFASQFVIPRAMASKSVFTELCEGKD